MPMIAAIILPLRGAEAGSSAPGDDLPAPPSSAVIAAIHQPNFFPWLGYFNKIARCDVFVVLDDVQYQKTGSSWSNRVKLLVGGEPRWVTAPVRRRPHGTTRIDELSWAGDPWREKLLRTLASNYAGAAFYCETMELLEPLVRNDETLVERYNMHAVQAICAALGLGRTFVSASRFRIDSGSNERLIELCRAVDCDTYLAGGGAQEYQHDDLFAAAGVALRYQDFRHPTYPQRGVRDFVPGLSIIDALMNCGIPGTRELVGVGSSR